MLTTETAKTRTPPKQTYSAGDVLAPVDAAEDDAAEDDVQVDAEEELKTSSKMHNLLKKPFKNPLFDKIRRRGYSSPTDQVLSPCSKALNKKTAHTVYGAQRGRDHLSPQTTFAHLHHILSICRAAEQMQKDAEKLSTKLKQSSLE